MTSITDKTRSRYGVRTAAEYKRSDDWMSKKKASKPKYTNITEKE